MKDIKAPDVLLQEFTDTHNKIIQSLNDAEKGHAETLSSFIAELEKRKNSIEEVNSGIDSFNSQVKTTSIRLEDLNQHINKLSVMSSDIEFKLDKLQKNVTSSLQEVAKNAFKDFLFKARLIMVVNVFIIAVLVYIVFSRNA